MESVIGRRENTEVLEELKEQTLNYSRKMLHRGLTRGTGGNISVRDEKTGLIVITGSGIDYDEMTLDDIVVVDPEGRTIEGRVKPSSELPMHLACYKARPDAMAAVHTHSTFATVMSCMQKKLRTVHYLIGFAGGEVECIPFCPIGSEELAQTTARALEKRNAVLLGNHGLMAVGPGLKFAFSVAEETEFVAELCYRTELAGGAEILGREDIAPIVSFAEKYLK